MLIQYILILGVVLLLVLFLRHHGTSRTAAWVKVGFVLFVVFSVFAVLRPDTVSVLAQFLGVGRGTDLLIYVIAVGFAFTSINTYLRFKELEGRYAQLARAIALRDSRVPEHTAAAGRECGSDDG
ncbi:hypothetical protein DFQ14_12113 [Halopolyspora algeriensis]|uniref:DUF2304 domain-containing protein n=1 Tax=Halopolyspora algeriensis TaxID=1500506 RepID=A0A368VHM9_9ACTN|nr:DUF2304 domain-containing protein [Halopolyspora algeriensis]RCW38511.1 hypothetical protein DFQ14_12113 [Halopolyspora algeriensis]TQM42592.1 hypothetical protein FHU43_4227 [Halopolyspora algeriensis]